jgi:hypothetical protein
MINAAAAINVTPNRPPTTPPTIAPVLEPELDLLLGFWTPVGIEIEVNDVGLGSADDSGPEIQILR